MMSFQIQNKHGLSKKLCSAESQSNEVFTDQDDNKAYIS